MSPSESTFIVGGVDSMTGEAAEALFEHGCDAATSFCDGGEAGWQNNA